MRDLAETILAIKKDIEKVGHGQSQEAQAKLRRIYVFAIAATWPALRSN